MLAYILPKRWLYLTSKPSTQRSQGTGSTNSQPHRAKAAGRIMVNLLTFNMIAIITAVIVVLASIGFFYQQIVLNDLDTDRNAISPYSQSCKVDTNGFILGTCTPVEVATTGAPAWSTIGQRLALEWRAQSSSPYFVTTCIKTKPTNANQVALVLMAGYDGFPQCQPPKGAQEIAGMAMVEATVRDEYPNGAFMLTVFADKTMSDSILHTNSDGTTDMLIANINQTLIATNGSMTVDRLGVNGVHYSVPIGTRYKISIQSYPVVLDITSHIDPNTWWNVGRMSKKAVTMTWDYGHAVANRTELVVLDLVFLFCGTIFISGDYYLTYQGLKGFLARKPVMTYDLAAGMERRKLVLFFWICSRTMSLVYPDVVRVVPGPTTFFWFLSTLLVCSFYICTFAILLGWLSYVPSPFKRVITISLNAMNQLSFLGFETVYMSALPWILENYRQSPQALSLNISGVLHPSGAYANDGQLSSAFSLLFPTSMIIIAICMIMSVSLSTYYHKRKYNSFFLSLEWARTNGFLSHCTMPNWMTGLPLDELK
ncbi:unnamed protein product, partial [Aphanomyces euteiches]